MTAPPPEIGNKTGAQPKRVGFVSLGCPKNLVDSEVMMGLLAEAGATLTPDAESADVLVVNTCSFIDKAKQESVDTILEMARHKTEGRAQKLIVAGCLVERYRDEIRKSIPEVDAVVGTGELDSILQAAGIEQKPVAPSPFTILTGSAAVHAGKEALSGTHHAARRKCVGARRVPQETGSKPVRRVVQASGADSRKRDRRPVPSAMSR